MPINKNTLIITSNIYGLPTRLKGGNFAKKDLLLHQLKKYFEKGGKYKNKTKLFEPVTSFLGGGKLSDENKKKISAIMDEWIKVNFGKRVKKFEERMKNATKSEDNTKYLKLLKNTIYKDKNNNQIVEELKTITTENYKKSIETFKTKLNGDETNHFDEYVGKISAYNDKIKKNIGNGEEDVSMENKYKEHIRKLEYVDVENKTHFDSPEYYELEINKNLDTFVLTNGMNKNFNSKGSGTTGAIYNIDKNAFNKDNRDVIYKPSDSTFNKNIKNIIYSNKQKLKYKTNGPYPAGTVFWSKIDKDNGVLKNIKKQVNGVYHINGIDWREVNIEKGNKEFIIPLITEYYSNIIKDFIDMKKGDVLHLAKIPGNIYRGGDETFDGMIKAIVNNKNNIMNNNKYLNLDITEGKYKKLMKKLQ